MGQAYIVVKGNYYGLQLLYLVSASFPGSLIFSVHKKPPMCNFTTMQPAFLLVKKFNDPINYSTISRPPPPVRVKGQVNIISQSCVSS